MASLELGNYVVLLILVGSAPRLDIKLILQREAQSGNVWFPSRGV
jgi:hypothetical protein